MTNFELGVRVPLIIRAPWLPRSIGKKTSALAEAVDNGEVLLEWDYAKGEPPAPLLKDVYGSERRRAKTLVNAISDRQQQGGTSPDNLSSARSSDSEDIVEDSSTSHGGNQQNSRQSQAHT